MRISVLLTNFSKSSSVLGNKDLRKNFTLGHEVFEDKELNDKNSLYSCKVSSRVGDTTIALRPSPYFSKCSIGAINDNDLPLPVSAKIIADLLVKRAGIACI